MQAIKLPAFTRYLLIPTLLLTVSCQNLPRGNAKGERITHVVVCWLKNPGNAADREKLIAVSKSFKAIPGVINVTAGVSLPTGRPKMDSNFDMAAVLTFADVKSLRAYEKNPIHQKAVHETLKPLVKDYVIYDFVNK